MISSPPDVSDNTPSNVLMISYLFPPVGGIGVQRPLKFVRYLGQYDWRVTVLTTDGVYSATMDQKLLNEIPNEVQVVRVRDMVSKLIGRFITGNPSSPASTSGL